jgi:hypothetical protein
MRKWAGIKKRIEKNSRVKQLTITDQSHAEWLYGWTPNRHQIEIMKSELNIRKSLFDSDKFVGSKREINYWESAFNNGSVS